MKEELKTFDMKDSIILDGKNNNINAKKYNSNGKGIPFEMKADQSQLMKHKSIAMHKNK